MSAKTRIVVLHMKKLVFAGVITGLGILLVIFLGILLGSSHKQSADNEAVETMYVPGVYTSSVMIDGSYIFQKQPVYLSSAHRCSIRGIGKGITRSVMPHMQISDKQILLCLCV